jgi:hypothetical protein
VKAWIDLSNSPHPLLFTPIRVAFEEEGHTVLMTARDNAQTLELARQRWPDVKPIGGQSPGGQRWTTSTNLRTTSHFGSRTASSFRTASPATEIKSENRRTLVIARAPPSGALYHRVENDVFFAGPANAWKSQ